MPRILGQHNRQCEEISARMVQNTVRQVLSSEFRVATLPRRAMLYCALDCLTLSDSQCGQIKELIKSAVITALVYLLVGFMPRGRRLLAASAGSLAGCWSLTAAEGKSCILLKRIPFRHNDACCRACKCCFQHLYFSAKFSFPGRTHHIHICLPKYKLTFLFVK